MSDSTVQILSALVIVLAFFVTVGTVSLPKRFRRGLVVRRIPAYERIPALIGRAIESDQPLHLSLGSAGLGGETTLLAIASAELAYRVTRKAAIGDTSPLLSMSETSAFPLGQDSLRRAYQQRGMLMRYTPSSVRWYPAGSRSLAFAAAITAMLAHERVSANLLAGSHGPELALIMEASRRRNITTLAVSDQLEGQAIAYALSDNALLGEEIFAAPTYIDHDQQSATEWLAIDALRFLIVLGMIAGLLANLISNGG